MFLHFLFPVSGHLILYVSRTYSSASALCGSPRDGRLLAGTRVQSDTLPPSVLVANQEGSGLIQFFASHGVVGYIFNANGETWAWIGER
jgi:hypothetical protein